MSAVEELRADDSDVSVPLKIAGHRRQGSAEGGGGGGGGGEGAADGVM